MQSNRPIQFNPRAQYMPPNMSSNMTQNMTPNMNQNMTPHNAPWGFDPTGFGQMMNHQIHQPRPHPPRHNSSVFDIKYCCRSCIP